MPRIPKPQGSDQVPIALGDSRAKGPPATLSLQLSKANYKTNCAQTDTWCHAPGAS